MAINKEQSNKIQLLRGLAIMSVVMIHNTPSGMAQVWCRPFINFGVGTFLFLSGFLSNSSSNQLKRIKKIAIPYILWTIVYVVLNNYQTPKQILFIYFKDLIIGQGSGIMYYVFVYCELMLLIPLIDKMAKSKYRIIGLIISPLEIIIMRLIPLIMGIKINETINTIMTISCLGWFSYFYLGYLIGNGIIDIKTKNTTLVILLICSIGLQFVEGYWYYSIDPKNCGSQLKLSALLTGILLVLLFYKFIISKKNPNIRVLRIMGDCSFGIFFLHPAIILIMRKIPYYSKVIIYPINAVFIIVLSTFFVLIGKKVFGKYGKYLAL